MLVLPLAGLLGLLLGSFYGLCARRGAAGRSIVRPGSHCPNCGSGLRAWELVPVVSYLALRGRCAHCAGRISPLYPLMECASAAWAVLAAGAFGLSPLFVAALALGGLFLVASAIDLMTFILPDGLTYPAAILGLTVGALRPDVGLASALAGAATGFGVFWLLGAAYRAARGRDGLGGGDMKLMLSIGGAIGLAQLPYAVLIGSLAALCASPWFLKGQNKSAMPIPFGPFLCLGAMICLLVGGAMPRLLRSF